MALLLPLLLVAMYILVLRPQRQRLRAHAQLVNAVEVGDEVIVAGGLFGRVAAVDDDRMRVEIAPGVEVEVLRRMVMDRLVEQPAYDGADGADRFDDDSEDQT